MDVERGIPLERLLRLGSFLHVARDKLAILQTPSHTRRRCLATRGSLNPLRGVAHVDVANVRPRGSREPQTRRTQVSI